MRIKLDIDNTIRDMGAEMVKLYNAKFGTSLTKDDIFDYDVDIAFPLLKENGISARDFFFNQNIDDVYTKAKPLNNAITGLKKLSELGVEIIIVSYQPNIDTKIRTLDWLTRYEVPYDALLFLNNDDKTIIETDYIVDDNPKFLDADSGIKVCVDWKYNRYNNYDYRIKSMDDLVKIIKDKL